MKKILVYLFCSVMLASLCTGCQSNNDSESDGCEYESNCSFKNFNITMSNADSIYGGISFDVEFENKTDEEYALSYTYFALVDKNNQSYSATAGGSLVYDTIFSNTKKKYTIEFEAAKIADLREIRFESNDDSVSIPIDGEKVAQLAQEKIDRIYQKRQDEENEKARKEAEEEQKTINNIVESNKKIALESINFLLAEPLSELPDYDDLVYRVVFGGYTSEPRPVRKALLDKYQEAYENGELTESNVNQMYFSMEYVKELNNEAYERFYKNHPEVTKEYSGEVLSIAESCNVSDPQKIDRIEEGVSRSYNTLFDCNGIIEE